MSQAKPVKKLGIDLAAAREQAAAIYSSYKKLDEAIDDSLRKELNAYVNPHSTLGDVSDQLALIESALIAKTDGRPQPLDFYEGERQRWAECCAPGYREIADIGDLQFDAKDLKKLRDWINDVLQWHETNPIKPMSNVKGGVQNEE